MAGCNCPRPQPASHAGGPSSSVTFRQMHCFFQSFMTGGTLSESISKNQYNVGTWLAWYHNTMIKAGGQNAYIEIRSVQWRGNCHMSSWGRLKVNLPCVAHAGCSIAWGRCSRGGNATADSSRVGRGRALAADACEGARHHTAATCRVAARPRGHAPVRLAARSCRATA